MERKTKSERERVRNRQSEDRSERRVRKKGRRKRKREHTFFQRPLPPEPSLSLSKQLRTDARPDRPRSSLHVGGTRDEAAAEDAVVGCCSYGCQEPVERRIGFDVA